MRKIREVLRLKFELKLDNRQIAASCKISHVTVGKYLVAIRRRGVELAAAGGDGRRSDQAPAFRRR